MGYQMESGRWADTEEVELISGTLDQNTDGAAVELGDRGVLRLEVAVTDLTGTAPKLNVEIETSPDAATWTLLGTAFAEMSAVGVQRKIFSGCDRYVRASCAVTGTDTPTVTLSITGEAV